jgi:DnaK suppressor protein
MTRTNRDLDPALRAEFSRRLGEAREALFRTLAITDEEMASLGGPEPGAPVEHVGADSATVLLARLEERERREIDEILAAQARLEAGSFGLCLRCGEPLLLARLRAMPAARYCVACQSKEETRR